MLKMMEARRRFACFGRPGPAAALAAVVLLLGPLGASARPGPGTALTAQEQGTIEAAIAAVTPALVKIDVVIAEYQDGQEKNSEASGSGVIITRQGHVITNHHVAGHAKRLMCTLANRERIEARLVGSDPLSDIAVIKLEPGREPTFPAAAFGDSSLLKLGDRVLAMGSPLAFSQSVTMGIIANRELVMPKDDWRYRVMLEGEDVGSIVSWIAHDADIYPGNSGGPLVNLRGEIVGINELRMGLSAAIPSNLAREVAAQLIDRGEVTRSWMGLEVQPQLEQQTPHRGVLVSGTVPGSPAERAGFRPGDLLVRLAGHEVNVEFREELVAFNRLALGLPMGAPAEAVVLRGGEQVTLSVVPEQRERVEPEERALKGWGICARDLSLMTIKEMGLASREGVLVTSVQPGGPGDAARPALEAKDVIVRVGETAAKDLEELAAVTKAVIAGATGPTPALVTFVRGGGRYLTVVKLGTREIEDPSREVRKAWLPVDTQVLTRDIAQAIGIPGRTGVLVTRVYDDSTAQKAGLQMGDVIVAVNGEPVSASEPQDLEVLPAMIRQLRIGSAAEVTVVRNGEERKLAVELVASPPLPREMKRYRDVNFGLTVRDITFFDRVDQRWAAEQQGVVVQEVAQGGWAALGGAAAGDLIVAVDAAPAPDVEAVKEIMAGVAQRRPDSVVLQVVRGIHHLYVELRPAWGEPEPAPAGGTITNEDSGGNHGN
jgi:serine protease Do